MQTARPAIALLFPCTTRHRPSATLFPYTTLFRSNDEVRVIRALEIVRGGGGALYGAGRWGDAGGPRSEDTRLNSSHITISYAVFCLKKKKQTINEKARPMQLHAPSDIAHV